MIWCVPPPACGFAGRVPKLELEQAAVTDLLLYESTAVQCVWIKYRVYVAAQMVISSYEARQAELMQESKGLQAALADLQSDYRILANKQAAAQQLQAAVVSKVVEEEDLQGLVQLPDATELQAELASRMAVMKQKIEAVYDGPTHHVSFECSKFSTYKWAMQSE